jgi:hypothetical protein
MQEARENGQNFNTSGSNSPPRYQMPHHMEDLERQIPYSLEKTRIDRYITRGFIFVFIYIELSQIYKSIFKLTINYSNSHIVQDERKQISCESPLAWRRLDAAWMQLCL